MVSSRVTTLEKKIIQLDRKVEGMPKVVAPPVNNHEAEMKRLAECLNT